jgi:hypothetical protein
VSQRVSRPIWLGDAAAPKAAHPGIMAQTFGVALIYVL